MKIYTIFVFIICVLGGLAVFEQGVEASLPAGRQGAGTAAPKFFVRQSDASRLERSFASQGQNKRPCEKIAKTGPNAL